VTPEERALIGKRWLEQGLGEHASVAAFARFVLHLMKLAAPPELLLAAIKAMEEEVHHARYCFGIASRFTGVPAGPGELSLESVLDASDEPAAILEASIIEGCVNETISAKCAEVALERTTDEGIRKVLSRIVEEEGRHADLSWRFTEWMLTRHPSLLPLAQTAFGRALAVLPANDLPDEPVVMEQYGHLTARSRAEVRKAMLQEVITPRAIALVGTQGLAAAI